MTKMTEQTTTDAIAAFAKSGVDRLIVAELTRDPAETARVLWEARSHAGEAAMKYLLIGTLDALIAELSRDGTTEDLMASASASLAVLDALEKPASEVA